MSWMQDAKQAARGLRRRPGLVATAVASLALGIGANSAIFSVVDAVLLKPLPFPEAGQLRLITEYREGRESGSNPARLRDWDEQLSGIDGAMGFYGEGVILMKEGEPRRVQCLRMFGRPFAVLGVKPAIGRAFTEGEEKGEGSPVAIVSNGFWQREMGGDVALEGKTLSLSGVVYTVVGVMPESFTYPEDVDVLTPGDAGMQATPRSAGFLQVIARMKRGVSEGQLQEQVNAAAERMRQEYASTDAGRTARVRPVLSDVNAEARTPLLALLGAVGFVLMIACVNLSGLLLARAVERRRESAIRSALGVSRWGLVRLYLSESLILAVVGGVCGVLVGAYGLDVLKKVLPAELPRLGTAELDWRVVGFASLAALACGVLSGLAPAWQASRATVMDGLREGSAAAAGVTRSRMRQVLVAAQVALSMMLLAGAALLGESLLRLRQSPLGFQAENVVTMEIGFPWGTPKERLDAFNREALERFGGIAGVRAAGWADRLPLEGGTQSGEVRVRGKELSPQIAGAEVCRRGASAGYFAAMRIPLRRGRLFVERENVREVVVNESLSKLLFGESDAVGQAIAFPDRSEEELKWHEITGVVADVRQTATGTAAVPEAYLPREGVYWPLASFAIRSEAPAEEVMAAARAMVKQMDGELVIDKMATMEQKVEAAREAPKVRAWLVGGFAMGALLLALVGLYGMVASELAHRKREFAVRMALGADRQELVKTGLKAGMRVTLVGIALGLGGAAVMGKAVEGILFGVNGIAVGAYGAAALVLLIAAGTACARPAMRAARTDPAPVLRGE